MINMMTYPKPEDLDKERGRRAYAWMSFFPERRAASDIENYVATILELTDTLDGYAKTEAQKAEAAAQIERFRVGFIKWQNILWDAASRTASPMITGPARFPVARNRKALDAERRKVEAFQSWRERARRAAIKAVEAAGVQAPEADTRPPETLAIGDVEIVTNYELGRIQIVFPGKPGSDTIAALKGAGWKWSPRNEAWQRMITPASLRSAKQIVGAK